MEEIDYLDKYRNTKKLYIEVKAYLDSKHIKQNTPFPIVAVYVNKCVRRFAVKKKPPIKVLNLCFYYLDKMEYKY